jgi:hypothetical protein
MCSFKNKFEKQFEKRSLTQNKSLNCLEEMFLKVRFILLQALTSMVG